MGVCSKILYQHLWSLLVFLFLVLESNHSQVQLECASGLELSNMYVLVRNYHGFVVNAMIARCMPAAVRERTTHARTYRALADIGRSIVDRDVALLALPQKRHFGWERDVRATPWSLAVLSPDSICRRVWPGPQESICDHNAGKQKAIVVIHSPQLCSSLLDSKSKISSLELHDTVTSLCRSGEQVQACSSASRTRGEDRCAKTLDTTQSTGPLVMSA